MGWSTLGCNQQDLWGTSERFVNCKPARMVPKVAGGASSKYGTSKSNLLIFQIAVDGESVRRSLKAAPH